MSGNPQQGAIQMYPDDSLQSLVSSWWEKEESQALFHVLTLIDYVSPVEKPMLSHHKGKRTEVLEVVIKILLQPIQIF